MSQFLPTKIQAADEAHEAAMFKQSVDCRLTFDTKNPNWQPHHSWNWLRNLLQFPGLATKVNIEPIPQPIPWHLFYVEAETSEDPDESCIKAYLVSAQSDSQAKAEELARAAIEETIPEGCRVEHSRFVCITSADVLEELGERA